MNKSSDLGRQHILENERNCFQAEELGRWQTMQGLNGYNGDLGSNETFEVYKKMLTLHWRFENDALFFYIISIEE